jgi:hypothetical protein
MCSDGDDRENDYSKFSVMNVLRDIGNGRDDQRSD